MKIQIVKPLGVNDIVYGQNDFLFLGAKLFDCLESLNVSYPFFAPSHEYEYRERFWELVLNGNKEEVYE